MTSKKVRWYSEMTDFLVFLTAEEPRSRYLITLLLGLQKQSTPLDDFSSRGAPCAPSQKVFIQRDYSEGTSVKFQSKFPPELEGRVSKRKLKQN